MRGSGIHDLFFAQVPDFDAVVVAAGGEVPACRQELHGDQLFGLVALKTQDALAGSQVPEVASTVKVTAGQQ